jgi:hypothetical protein
MNVPVPLVWLAPEPPRADQSRALSSWAHAHGVTLEPPRREAVPALAIDARIAESVETWLERARDAVAAGDGDEADRVLSRAESGLWAHPELPQAAWLMAEVERARAARWRRVAPTDREAAADAWLRAEALDGGRVAGVGEEGLAKHPAPATVVVDLSPADAELWLDATAVRGAAIATHGGLHALVVTSSGVPVWAAWREISPGNSTVRVTAPGAPPCSAADLFRVRLTHDAIEAGRVQCNMWVAAVAGAQPGSVRATACEADHCGPLRVWFAPMPWTWSPPAERGRESSWPTWATIGLAGAGAAIAAGVAVLAITALQPAPTETRFVNGGIKKQ